MIVGSFSATATFPSPAHLVLLGEGTQAPGCYNSSTTSMAAGVASTTFSGSGAWSSVALPGCSKPRVEDGLHRETTL
jgi:hypothetical protein